MVENDDGFVVPRIDYEKCVECGQCRAKCPVLDYSNDNVTQPKVYAIAASDKIRAQSSSGGLFTLLAQYVLSKRGVVYGVIFDSNLKVRYSRSETQAGIDPMRGSKYVQSDVGDTYRSVKQDLKSGRVVLFTGTPCQISALYNVVGSHPDNLYTLDILCHGVPSQSTLDQYLRSFDRPIVGVSFRDKANGWRADKISVCFHDRTKYVGGMEDTYELGFQKNIFLRSCCSNCKFCEFPRVGDVSTGDFWGISKLIPALNDGKGLSIVFQNNGKGEHLLKSIKPHCKLMRDVTSEVWGRIPNRVKSYYPAHPQRDRYFRIVRNRTVGEAVDMVVKNRYDIGMVGIYSVGNFGGALTNFALYSALENLGYSVLLIERPNNAKHKPNLSRIYKIDPYPPSSKAKIYGTKEEMVELNNFTDVFVVGSDQMFNAFLYHNFGEWVTLDWVYDNKKKIAYAASFGHDCFWGDEDTRATMSYFMQKFDAFSVREKSGVGLAKTDFDVDAIWVLDPVFLCPRENYSLLAKHSDSESKPHIFAYILDPDDDKIAIVRKASDQYSLPVEMYTEFNPPKEYVDFFDGCKIVLSGGYFEDRLKSLISSDLVVTDSFHGTCLALIFNKPFIAVLNGKRGTARFNTLIELFDVGSHVFNKSSEIEFPLAPLDYDKINSVLEKERNRCLEWLNQQITKPIKKAYSDYDMLRLMSRGYEGKLLEYSKEIRLLKKQIGELQAIVSTVSLGNITDICAYFDVLTTRLRDYLVIISVRDTPGVCLSEDVMRHIACLGVKTNLVKSHWCSYIAVVCKGDVVFDKKSEVNEALEYRRVLESHDLFVVSKALKAGNVSMISIDGKDYSKNHRGLNVVVYDLNNNTLVDSVTFDTHVVTLSASR